MLDINYIRKNIDQVEENCKAKKSKFDREKFISLDLKRRALLQDTEQSQAKKNEIAKQTGIARRTGENIDDLREQSIAISRQLDEKKKELSLIEKSFKDFCLDIPNMFHESVPVGANEKDNKFIREFGEKPNFSFTPKPHWELKGLNGSFDFERASKISGSRFCVYKGSFAKLERVLINFMLEFHTEKNGYTEILPPFMVNSDSLIGTGNLPKFKEDLYKIEDNDLYLVPTAEVPLTNLHRKEVLVYEQLPMKYVAYTPCFRSEAGSYGKDIRGIIRQHQFNKVELLKFSRPEDSLNELEKLTADAEAILKALGLHYRVMLLCSGDISFSSAKTYDLEVWMPNRGKYVEISSCSNFVDFQARRAQVKYKSQDGKQKGFAHTLNGSGLAIGRTVAAIIENYQLEDGMIKIPKVLREYFSGEELL